MRSVRLEVFEWVSTGPDKIWWRFTRRPEDGTFRRRNRAAGDGGRWRVHCYCYLVPLRLTPYALRPCRP